jgi:hypothetical protein
MARKIAAGETGEAGSKGTKKVQFVLRLEHIEALRRESLRRALDRSEGAADQSEVLREILDAWIAKSGKR